MGSIPFFFPHSKNKKSQKQPFSFLGGLTLMEEKEEYAQRKDG
jgi:hypothetical protein